MRENNRRDERYSLPLEVYWESLSGKHQARISDISLGGCYLESIAPVAISEQIHFEIQLPTGGRMPLRGEVVHLHPNLGFGLRFVSLSVMERNVLAHVMNELRQS